MVNQLRIACFVLVLLLSACGDGNKKAYTEPRKMRVPTELVQAVDFPNVDSEPGSVVTDDRIDLSSRVVGFIKNLYVREGQKVKKGDVLVQIDPTDVNEAIRQAQATVAAAKYDLADAERDLRAFSTGATQGWSSTDTRRKAQVRRDIAQTALTKAEAALASAQAQQAYTTISSPVGGVVVARYKHSGDMATTGVPILTIESRQVLFLKVFVPESNVGRIVPGMTASVRIDALQGDAIKGAVHRIIPSGDPVTRRYEVGVALPVSHEILPGMFGQAEFVLGSSPAPAIPKQVLVQRGGLEGVFVVDEKNVAHFRWLRLGREWNGLMEVTSGLSAGERILSRVDESVKDGVVILPDDKDGKNE
ncbi:MAG: efflux RND transporter periplasmic adaptor subunit [Oryzomonas sp.]|jgi:RND family efflux transporter MFP subunit